MRAVLLFNSIWIDINMHFSSFLPSFLSLNVSHFVRFFGVVLIVVVRAIGKNLNLMSIHYHVKGTETCTASLINLSRQNGKIKN